MSAGNEHGVAIAVLGSAGPITCTTDGLDTTILSLSMPANSIKAGTKFRIRASGSLTVSAAVNLIVQVMLGANSLVLKSMPVNQAGGWAVDFTATCRVGGASGSIVGMGSIVNKMSSTTSAQTDVVGPTVRAPDLTTTMNMILKFNLASSATETVTCEEADISLVKP